MFKSSLIRELAKDKKVKLKDLASEIGMTEAGLQRIFRENTTSIDSIERLCRYFDVPVSFFFEESSWDQYLDVNKVKDQLRQKDETIEALKQRLNECTEYYEKNRLLTEQNGRLVDELRELEKKCNTFNQALTWLVIYLDPIIIQLLEKRDSKDKLSNLQDVESKLVELKELFEKIKKNITYTIF